MTHYLDAAVEAARAKEKMLRHGFQQPLRVNSAEAHDIKLEIDVRAQTLITEVLLKKFPEHALYGEEGIVVGLSKTGVTIAAGLPLLQEMVHRARKCRLMGSAALDMAYVACGRFDAYIEQGISLWDIAAGWILVE